MKDFLSLSFNYSSGIKTAAQNYIDNGFEIVPLRPPFYNFTGKEPFHRDWPERIFTVSDLSDENWGIGLKTGIQLPDGSYFHVWDVDIYDPEQKDAGELRNVLLVEENDPFQITASGGLHYFFKTDCLFPADKFTMHNGAVELKSKGQQIVVAPTQAKGKDGSLRNYKLHGLLDEIPYRDSDQVKCIIEELNHRSIPRDRHGGGTKQGAPREYGKRDADYVFFYRQESSMLLKKYSTEEVLQTLELSFTNASSNYFKVHCPIHAPDENPSLIVYKKSGICYDTHDNKSYSIVDFIGTMSSNPQTYIFEKFGISSGQVFNRFETKKPIADLIGVKGEVIEFRGKITYEPNTVAVERVKKILTDSHNYNFIARTAAGKSSAIINMAKLLDLNMIYLVPYEVVARQFGNKFDLPAVYEGITMEQVAGFIDKSKIIISTYDGLEKINRLIFVPYKYILVEDEFHALCTQSNFRADAIRLIHDTEEQFKKIIRLTGTPEGIVHETDGFKTVIFWNLEESKRVKEDYEIIGYHEKGMEKVIWHLQSRLTDGKVVVFKNNINDLKVLREGLLNRGVKEEEICILNAREKDQDDYKNIVENQNITEETRVILTTSVISDGVDINNEDISAVYFVDCIDMILLRQFLGRFRNGVDYVYDFISANHEGYDGWYDMEVAIKSKSNLLEDLAAQLEQFLYNSVNDSYSNVTVIPHIFWDTNENLSLIYSNTMTDTLEPDLYRLRALELIKMNTVMLHWPERRQEYLKAFEDIDAVYAEWETLEESLENEKQKIKEQNKSFEIKTRDLLEKDKKKVITTYLRKMAPDEYVLNEDKYADFLLNDDFDHESYFAFNKEVLNTKPALNVIKNFLRLSDRGFDEPDVLELCVRPRQKITGLMKNLDCLKILRIYNKYDGLEKLGRRSLGLVDYEILKFLNAYFKKNKEFLPEDLCKKLNEHLKRKKLTIDFKQPEVMKIANMLFDIERKNGHRRLNSKKKIKVNYYVYCRQRSAGDINELFDVNLNVEQIETIIRKEVYKTAKMIKENSNETSASKSILKSILENEYE